MQQWIRKITMALFIGVIALTTQAATAAQESTCTFSPSMETVPVYAAPLNDVTQQRGRLQQGSAYPVTARYGETTMFMVDLGDVFGWVDGRSGYIDGDCQSLPRNDQALDDFSSVCTFTAVGPAALGSGVDMTSSEGTLPDGASLPVVRQHGDRYLLRFDDAKGAWVQASAGRLSGSCNALPGYQSHGEAVTTDPTNVWSLPDVLVGNIMVELPAGIPLMVEAGPVYGPVRRDTGEYGYWYQVASVGSGETLGWVWEGRIRFNDPFPSTNGTAITLENTRVWSMPDVHQGMLISHLPPDLTVTVNQGPVTGPIRLDSSVQGDWYHIQSWAISGWVWAGRLHLNDS